MHKLVGTLAALGVLLVAAPAAEAQGTPQSHPPLAVGTMAPDFTLPGATRFGVLRNPIHLHDFRGKTVVIAFFYKARTKG